MTHLRTVIIETVALLGSLGTLICCALPALLVSLGAGATMASLVTNLPQLVWLSEHKVAVFSFAAIMLVMSGVTMSDKRRLPCPTDPQKAKSCIRVRRLSAGIFFVSLAIYAVGFFFAFVASRIV
jgi:hypothetical protein